MPEIAYYQGANMRSAKYVIAETRTRCRQCNSVTRVFAFALPVGYESLYVDDDTSDDEDGTWEAQGMAAVLSYVEYLHPAIANRIGGMTPHYRIDLATQGGGVFWMNHCEQCGSQFEEEELHGDPDSPFGSMPFEGREPVQAHRVQELFAARAGVQSHHVKAFDS